MVGSRIWEQGKLTYAPSKAQRKKPKYGMKNNNNVRVVRPRMKGLPQYNSASPFSFMKFCNLSYADHFVLTTGTLQLFGTEQTMILNGLFDFDSTGTGHQPYGFDTMMQIYNKYKVYAVKIEVNWTNPEFDGLFVGYKLGSPGDGNNLGGMAYARAKELYGTNIKPINDSGGQRIRTILYTPMNKALNITKLQFKSNIDQYTGSASANPARVPTVRFAVINPSSTTSRTVQLGIKATFFTQFYERKVLTQS